MTIKGFLSIYAVLKQKGRTHHLYQLLQTAMQTQSSAWLRYRNTDTHTSFSKPGPLPPSRAERWSEECKEEDDDEEEWALVCQCTRDPRPAVRPGPLDKGFSGRAERGAGVAG